jgi:serine/threonine/tyrosine-interacting protein
MTSKPRHEPALPYGNSNSYLARLPQVPHPPTEYDYSTGRPVINLQTPPADSIQYLDDKYGDPSFLRQLGATKPTALGVKQYEWTYSSRRQAQSITPFLYLGPGNCMRDAAFLDTAGITFLLAVRSAKVARNLPHYLQPSTSPAAAGRQTAVFDTDNPFEFIANVRPVIRTIINHIQTKSKLPIQSMEDVKARILICCETGNDRSATLVAAILMIIYGCSPREALQVIYSQRTSVSIVEDMRRMLLGFDDILAAERQVLRAQLTEQDSSNPILAAQVVQEKKRGRETYDVDGDEDMEGEDWGVEAEGKRTGVAPFIDSTD